MILKMLHMFLPRMNLVMFCMALFFLCGCEASFVPLFEYTEDNVFLFDAKGKIIKPSDYIPPEKRSSSDIKTEITERGEYKISQNNFVYCGNPGDRVFPMYKNGDQLYLLTEKDSDYMQLMIWNRNLKKILLYPHTNREAQSIIIHKKLHGIQYAGDCFQQDYFTCEFKNLDEKLRKHYRTENLLWIEKSPDGKLWIAELFFREKPSLYVLCDMDIGEWRELSKAIPYKPDLTQKKEVFRFIPGDGKEISGILSFPPIRFGRRNLPLIVFPHGGPQTRSMLIFDPRVELLTRNGFLVFQPNYRGSTGQGKKFRQSGWGAVGIRRALADIAEGTEALIQNGFADPDRIAILGGSWGAYCAIESAVLYPEIYHAVIAFFGPTDLVAMLQEFLPDSGANASLDRLQYGDVKDPVSVSALKNISPYYFTDRIQAPILLYHYEQDQVISFQQSLRFYERMKADGKNIVFIRGNGKHGFSTPDAEVAAYNQVIRFLKQVFHK